MKKLKLYGDRPRSKEERDERMLELTEFLNEISGVKWQPLSWGESLSTFQFCASFGTISVMGGSYPSWNMLSIRNRGICARGTHSDLSIRYCNKQENLLDEIRISIAEQNYIKSQWIASMELNSLLL